MKTPLVAMGLACLIISAPRGACAVDDDRYQAFWLSLNEKGNEYVDLVMSRRPLADLVGAHASTNTTVLDSAALVLTTYAKDSIWNIDRRPLKALRQVEKVGNAEVTIAGQVFTWTKADMKDAVRILENPEGKIRIHRIHSAAAGQEDEIRQLAKVLRKQIEDEANKAPEDTARKFADPQR
jgi:hypothetical protein